MREFCTSGSVRASGQQCPGATRPPEGKAAFKSLAVLDPREKAKTLRSEATKVGLASCALADFYDRNASSPASSAP